MNRRSIALISALAIAAASGGSLATAGPAEDQMRVALRDLDLRNGEGADRAFRRIQRAADTFCDVRPGERSLSHRADTRACRDRMTYLAVNKLDSRLVTARYERSGSRPPIELATR